MASAQNTEFPVEFSAPEVQAAIVAKWNELKEWQKENQINEEDFDLTFPEFVDEIRVAI